MLTEFNLRYCEAGLKKFVYLYPAKEKFVSFRANFNP